MNSIKEKIAKLLNMTTANGATEDEAETALRLASGMAAKHGIDLAACAPAGAPRPKIATKQRNEELKPHQAYAAMAAAALYGVECNVYSLGAGGIMFVGREELIELAEQTMFWLFRQIEDLYKQALPKGLSKTARSEFRKTFKAACAVRVHQRANALVLDMMRNNASAQSATGQNALVVSGYFQSLHKEIREFWDDHFRLTPEEEAQAKAAIEALAAWRKANPKLAAKMDKEAAREMRKRMNRKGPRQRQVPTGSGTQAGYSAGDRVKLREEVQNR